MAQTMQTAPAATVERLDDGRYYIRTAAGNVARSTSSAPWYTRDPAKAVAALGYLALPYARRRLADHWLKSTFGLEG